MRGKRSKQYRKLMQQYVMAFGFRLPYQVLVDAQMIQDAHRYSMDLVGQLSRTLHGEIKPMITNCSIRHIYALSVSDAPSSLTTNGTSAPSPPTITPATKTALLAICRTLTMRRCNHQELASPLSALECLSSVIDPKTTGRNPHNLILACHDDRVRTWARRVTGLPSIFVKRSVMVMEPMSDGSVREIEGKERGKLRAGARKGPSGTKRKRDDDGAAEDRRNEDDSEGEDEAKATHDLSTVCTDGKKKRKAKGSKGPNPLSVKKKKKDGGSAKPVQKEHQQGTEDQVQSKPRKRKRKADPRPGKPLEAEA